MMEKPYLYKIFKYYKIIETIVKTIIYILLNIN